MNDLDYAGDINPEKTWNLLKNNKAELSKNFLKVESELAKSVNKGVYKKNTAARIISRLAKKIKSIN